MRRPNASYSYLPAPTRAILGDASGQAATSRALEFACGCATSPANACSQAPLLRARLSIGSRNWTRRCRRRADTHRHARHLVTRFLGHDVHLAGFDFGHGLGFAALTAGSVCVATSPNTWQRSRHRTLLVDVAVAANLLEQSKLTHRSVARGTNARLADLIFCLALQVCDDPERLTSTV